MHDTCIKCSVQHAKCLMSVLGCWDQDVGMEFWCFVVLSISHCVFLSFDYCWLHIHYGYHNCLYELHSYWFPRSIRTVYIIIYHADMNFPVVQMLQGSTTHTMCVCCRVYLEWRDSVLSTQPVCMFIARSDVPWRIAATE